MDNVIVCSLINGREIIGIKVEETDTTITLEHALAAAMFEQAPGQFGVRLIPVSPLLGQDESGMTLPINKAALCFPPTEPNSEVIAVYRQVKSPIQLPPSNDNVVRGGFTKR